MNAVAKPVLAAAASIEEDGLNRDDLRFVAGHFATGVAVVTAVVGREPVGMTIQSFTSLSLDPPLVMFSVGKSSSSWPRIARAGGLAINLLGEDQHGLAQGFSRSRSDKFAGVTWSPAAVTGAPELAGAMATIECRICDVHPGGDHMIVVCGVERVAVHQSAKPLIYFRSSFHGLRSHKAW